MMMCLILTSTTFPGTFLYWLWNTGHALSFLNIKSEHFIFLKYPLVIFMHCQQLVSVTLSFYSQLSYFQPRFKLQGGVGWVGSLFRAKLSGKGHFSIWRRVLNWNEKWSLLKKKTIADDCLSNDPPNAKEESYKQVIFKLAKEEHKTEGTYKKSCQIFIHIFLLKVREKMGNRK